MTELTRSRERFKPGSLLLGRYEVVRAVGIGTIGEVLHVLDHQLDYQSIALKILHPHLLRDEKVFQRFQNEVLISRQLANEHIVRVYDLVSEADSQYLVVEYVPGCNLAEAMLGYDHQRLPLQDFLYIFQQILVAIVHAHQQNVVHRDLKPANILLDQNGTVKLTDFGLARSIESAHGLTRTGEIVGSPAYLAPEQFRSPSPAVSADIYSVGILAFELLTGSLPFSGESLLALARAHIAEPFPVERLSARGVPNWLTVLIASCCEKDPALRPSSTREILEKIEAALLKESTAKEREFSQTQIRSKIRKNQRDISLFTKRWRRAVVAVWVGCVFTVFNFVLFEPGSRKRMTAWAIQTEIQTDIDSAPIQRLIFGDYDPRDPEAIFKAVHRPDDGPILSLIQGGASPMIYFTDRPRETVLHRAIRTNARYLDHLLRGDYNYDLGNEAGETPLLLATRLGAQGVIGPLLNLGVDINKRDNQGNSPLLVAVATGQADSVIAILNSRTTQGETDWPNNSGIQDAMAPRPTTPKKKSTFVDLDRHHRGPDGNGAIHLAILTENANILQQLLKRKFDPDFPDMSGQTGLMLITKSSYTTKRHHLFNALRNAGASLKPRDHNGKTVYDHARDGDLHWLNILNSGSDQ